MRLRVSLIAALLAAISLAGCSEEGNVPPQGDDTGDGGDGDGGDDVPEGSEGGNNTAPTANLTASIVNGTAPLNVTFTLGGADADGDNLTWTLVANGTELANGSALPATVDHLFDAGSFYVLLTVSDGSAQTGANLTVAAVAGVAGPPPEDKTFTGSITGVWEPVGGYSHDAVVHAHEVPSAPKTMSVHLTWSRTGGAVDLDVLIYDPSGAEVARGTNYNDPVQGDDKEEELVVVDDPAALASIGTWEFHVISAGSVQADYTLAVTFT